MTWAARPRLRPALGALGGLVAVWALTPIAVLLIDAAIHGGVLSGAGGATAGADQFQYLSWIRESGAHGLIANRFDLAGDAGVFLEPIFLISGALWRLGLSLQASLLIWEPVAIVVLVGGFTAFAARTEHGVALVAVVGLAIFYLTPLLPLLDWTGALGAGPRFRLMLGLEELSPAWQLWGYLPTAISLGLMPLTLLAGERVLAGGRRTRSALAAAAAGSLLIAWLHPWQGATLVLIWLGLLAWGRGARARVTLLWPAVAALAPLIYYQVLSHTDPAWRLAQRQNAEAHFSAWVLAAALAPLALPGLLGAVRRPASAHDRAIRLWVLGGLLVYLLQSTFEEHALQGLALPLALLAADGWRRLWGSRRRAAATSAVAAIAVLTIPGVIWSANWYRDSVRGHFEPYRFTDSEHAALEYLDHDPRSGGVLAGRYLGMAVPAFTGRATWVGHKVWTPDWATRSALANRLLGARMAPARARALVRASGAAFLLADCSQRGDLGRLLGPLVRDVRRFGCVTVYQVQVRAPIGRPGGPADSHIESFSGALTRLPT